MSASRIRDELLRQRKLSRIPVRLPSAETVTISPGGQNPLIKTVIEEFCSCFVPGGTVVYIGDAENKFLHLDRITCNSSVSCFRRRPRCQMWWFTTRNGTGCCSLKL